MVDKNPLDFDPEELLADILPPGIALPEFPDSIPVDDSLGLGLDALPAPDEFIDEPLGGRIGLRTALPEEEIFEDVPLRVERPVAGGKVYGDKDDFNVFSQGNKFSLISQSEEQSEQYEMALERSDFDELLSIAKDPGDLNLSGSQLKVVHEAMAKHAVEFGYGENPPLDVSLKSVMDRKENVLQYITQAPFEAMSSYVGYEGMPGELETPGDWGGGQLVGLNDFRHYLKDQGLPRATASRIAGAAEGYAIDREADSPLLYTQSEEASLPRNVQEVANAFATMAAIPASYPVAKRQDITNFLENVPARDGSKVQAKWYRAEEHMAYSVPDIKVMAKTFQLFGPNVREDGLSDIDGFQKVRNGMAALLTASHELNLNEWELYEQIVNSRGPQDSEDGDELIMSFLKGHVSAGHLDALREVLGLDAAHPFGDLPGFLFDDQTLMENAPFEWARDLKEWLKKAQSYHSQGAKRAKNPGLQKRIDLELDPESAQEVARQFAAVSPPMMPEGISPEDVPYNWDLIGRLDEIGLTPDGESKTTEEGAALASIEFAYTPSEQALFDAGFNTIHEIRELTEEEARKRIELQTKLGDYGGDFEPSESFVNSYRKKQETSQDEYVPPLVGSLSAATVEDLETPEERDEYFVKIMSLLGATAGFDTDEMRSLGDKIFKNTLSQDAADQFINEVANSESAELKNFIYNYFGQNSSNAYAEHLKMVGIDPESFDPDDAMDWLEYGIKKNLNFMDWRDSSKGTSWYENYDEYRGFMNVRDVDPFNSVADRRNQARNVGGSGGGRMIDEYDYFEPGKEGESLQKVTREPGADIRRSGLGALIRPVIKIGGSIAKAGLASAGIVEGLEEPFEEDLFLKSLQNAIASAEGSRGQSIMYNLLEKGHMGEYFRDNPQEFQKMYTEFKLQHLAEMSGSSYLETYTKNIITGFKAMPEDIALSVYHLPAALAAMAEGEELTEKQEEAIEKAKEHYGVVLLDLAGGFSLVGGTFRGVIKGYRGAKNKFNEWTSEHLDTMLENVPPENRSAAKQQIIDNSPVENVTNLDPPVRDPQPVQFFKPFEDAIYDVPSDISMGVEAALSTADEFFGSIRAKASIVLEKQADALRRSVAEGIEITTADGTPINPRHAFKLLDHSDSNMAGVELFWRPEGTSSPVGGTPISRITDFETARVSKSSNARQMALYEESYGNPTTASKLKELGISYEGLSDSQGMFRAEMDGVAPNRLGTDSSSVAVRKDLFSPPRPLMSSVVKDVVGDKPIYEPLKSLPNVIQYTAEATHRWNGIKQRLGFIKTKDGAKSTKAALDNLEIEISAREYGNVNGDLKRYRSERSPSERAEELALRGYADPVLYKELGLSNSEIYTAVDFASRFSPESSPMQAVDSGRKSVALSKNMSDDAFRVEEYDFRRAIDRGKAGIDDFSDLNLTQDQQRFVTEMSSGQRPKPYYEPVPSVVPELSPNTKIDFENLSLGKNYTAGEFLGRRVFGDEAYEQWSGKRGAIVPGEKIGPSAGPDKAMAVAAFFERPFAILNIPAWFRDFSGMMLADYGAGKGTLGGFFEKFYIRMSKKSNTLGRAMYEQMSTREAIPDVFAQHVQRTTDALKGSPDDLITYTFDDVSNVMRDAGLADSVTGYGNQFLTHGNLIANKLEANQIANALKVMDSEFVIETIDGVPIHLQDIAVKEVDFKGNWIPVDEMNKLVNDGVYEFEYVHNAVRGFRYKELKPLADMTSKQRFVMVMANDHIRFNDMRVFDATAQIIAATDEFAGLLEDSGVSLVNRLKRRKDMFARGTNWMSAYFDDRGVFSMGAGLMKKVGENLNDLNAQQALIDIDYKMGEVVPGAEFGKKVKASDLYQKFKDTPEMQKSVSDAVGGEGWRRYMRSPIWKKTLSWNEKIDYGLWDYNEALLKVHKNQGSQLADLKLMSAAREKGLLRSAKEIDNPDITPAGLRSQFVRFGDTSLLSDAAKKFFDKDNPFPLSKELEGLYIHKHVNDALVRQRVMTEKSFQMSNQIMSGLKLGWVLDPGTVIRNFFQNNYVMPGLSKYPTYTAKYQKEAFSTILKTKGGDAPTPEFESFSLLGGRPAARSRAERIANDEYIVAQDNFATEAKEWVLPLASKHNAEFMKGVELMYKSLEGGTAGLFMKGARLQRMKSPNFLGEKSPSWKSPSDWADLAKELSPPRLYQRTKKALKEAKKEAADLYGLCDDPDKFAYYLELTRDHGLGHRAAMEIVNGTLVDFNDMSPVIESISSSPTAILFGATFARWTAASWGKWFDLISGSNPIFAMAMMNASRAYQEGVALTVGQDPEELRSLMRRSNQVFMPTVEVMRKGMRGDDLKDALNFNVGYPGINAGSFAFGPDGYGMELASRSPDSFQEYLAIVSALSPVESTPAANALWSIKDLVDGKMGYIEGDDWSKMLNGDSGDVLSLSLKGAWSILREASPTLIRRSVKFIQGEMSWEDWVSTSTGIGPGASTSLFEQALVDGKTFNSSMNKIVNAYNDMSPEEQGKLKNQLVYHNVIYPFIGEDGLGLLGKKGAFYDKPAKKLTDDMIEQKKLKAFAMFVPVIMRALREVDDDYINKSGKGLKQIMNMMEKSGFKTIENPDGTSGFVPVPQ